MLLEKLCCCKLLIGDCNVYIWKAAACGVPANDSKPLLRIRGTPAWTTLLEVG